MAVVFGLSKGMTDGAIYRELKGRVSGETRQEMQLFYVSTVDARTVDEERKIALNAPLHEVVLASDEYALILKRDIGRSLYYLSGINDEGKYFVHILEGGFPYKEGMTMEEVLAWVNRADEGYSKRVQGDVLMMFKPLSELRESSRNYYPNEKAISFTSVNGTKTDVMARPVSENITVRDSSGSMVPKTILKHEVFLGNHKVSVDPSGAIYMVEYQNQQAIIAGKTIVLQHPEHGIETIAIPEGHMAVLSPQRGRVSGGYD